MEINNLHKYGAFDEVEDHGQERTASRWVITQNNNHGDMKTKIKACLVVKGLQEEEEPKSNPQAPSKEALNLITAIAANEEFSIRTLDINNAFRQDKSIERERHS